MKDDFTSFCIGIADKLGLIICPSHDPKRMSTMWSSAETNKEYELHCDFANWSNERRHYYCELSNRNGEYLGAITREEDTYEHFEVAVSPYGLYKEENGNPIDPDGNEIQGDGYVYYRGKSLAWACNSIMKGGSKKGRKPIEVF